MANNFRAGWAVWRQGLVGVGLVALAGLACDKVPLMAPSDSALILFANTTSIPINGTAEITATVIESSGTPVQNGTVVTFFTSLGTLDPPEARTQNGKATVRLRAGTSSGIATIRAASGGNTTIDPQLTISVGSAAAGRVELFATPASLPSGGGPVQLLAVVYDGGGNRMPFVQVAFSTTTGAVTSNTAVTDSNGEARSALNTTTAAAVTATVASTSDKTITATVNVTLRSAPTVSITTSTESPVAGQPVGFSITVGAGTSGAAVRSATVEFGDGGSQTLSTLGSTSVSHTYTRSGSYTVTATATDVAGESAVATASVTVAEPASLGVTVAASGTMTTESVITFTATVTPPTVIVDRYEWTFGDGGLRTTTGNITTHVYGRSSLFVVSVTVYTQDGRQGLGQVEITLPGPPPINVTLTAVGTSKTEPVSFTAVVTATTPPTNILRYEWNFGDGTPVRHTSGPTTSHFYETYQQLPQRYTVSVTVVTTEGREARAVTEIVLQ